MYTYIFNREEFKCVYLSISNILRSAVASKTDIGIEVKTCMDEGKLVPDDIMIELILARLQEADCVAHGWLLDGFPHTGSQAYGLTKAGIECDIFIHLDVATEILLKKVSGRKQLSGPINTSKINDKDEDANFKSPSDHEEIISCLPAQKSYDNEEMVVAHQLDAFNKNLRSALDFFNSKMFKVDGNRDPTVIWEEIKTKLNEI